MGSLARPQVGELNQNDDAIRDPAARESHSVLTLVGTTFDATNFFQRMLLLDFKGSSELVFQDSGGEIFFWDIHTAGSDFFFFCMRSTFGMASLRTVESASINPTTEGLQELVFVHDQELSTLKHVIARYQYKQKSTQYPRLGPFLFLGPTVAGIEELGKASALGFFGSADCFIQISMCNLLNRMERGAAYLGERRVILITEFELAIPEVIEALSLQQNGEKKFCNDFLRSMDVE